jgi:hypothetical protein
MVNAPKIGLKQRQRSQPSPEHDEKEQCPLPPHRTNQSGVCQPLLSPGDEQKKENQRYQHTGQHLKKITPDVVQIP